MVGILCSQCGESATEGTYSYPFCKKHWKKIKKELQPKYHHKKVIGLL